MPATLEIADKSSSDFQAAHVNGARLKKVQYSPITIQIIVGEETYTGPMPLTMFLLKSDAY